MYMREKTPIKEGATLPGKSHHYFFETHSNSDKGHESNQTLRRGQERKSVCVCSECIWHSGTQRLGSNKQDKTASEGKEETFSRELQQEEARDRQGDTLSHKAQRYVHIEHFYGRQLEFWRGYPFH